MSFINEITNLTYNGCLLLLLAITVFIGVTISVFNRPFNGTQLIFLTIPITIPLVGDPYGGMAFFNIRLYDLLTVLTFCAIVAAVCINKHRGFAKTVLGWPFFLYCIANLLSLFNSPYITDSIRQFLKLFAANVTMYLVITTTLNTAQRIEKVLKIMFSSGVLVCLVGTLQNIMFLFFDINWFFIKNNYRATATFAEAGWYAQYISLLFSIALPLYLSRAFKHWKRWLGVCICILLVVIASESSRAAYVATFSVIFVGLLLGIGGRDRIRVFAKVTTFVVLALVLASLLSSLLSAKLQFVRLRKEIFALDEPSNAIRVRLASQTWDHIIDHPVIGVGFGTWQRVITADLGVRPVRGGSAFNAILGVLYDAGILGLFAFGMICFSYLSACFRLLKSTSDPKKTALLQVAILVFVNLFVVAQFHPSWLIGYNWLGIAMGMAIVSVVRKDMADENSFCPS